MGGGGRTSRELAGRGSASTGGEGSRDGAVPLGMVTGDGVGWVPQVEWGHLSVWAGGHSCVCLPCPSPSAFLGMTQSSCPTFLGTVLTFT